MADVIHWFRRDLRVRDNAGLAAACAQAGADGSVTGIFVIDPKWWPATAGKLGAHQAAFWLESLTELQESLRGRNLPLVVRQGDPVARILQLAKEVGAEAVTQWRSCGRWGSLRGDR